MPRDPAKSTFVRILDEAEQLFSTRGYRWTRTADVARAVGVTEPALYRYFAGKDALFEQVMVRAVPAGRAYHAPATLPIPSPTPDAVLRFLRGVFAESQQLPELQRALRTPSQSAGGARDELAAVVGELFDLGARYAVGVRIMRASALESPELAKLWDEEHRVPLGGAIASYLDARARAGHLTLPADPVSTVGVVGRIIETHAVYPETVSGAALAPLDVRRGVVVRAVVAMLEVR